MSRYIRKLVFISDAPHFGGAERYIVAMSQAAVRRGIEPHIFWMPTAAADADVFVSARAESISVSSPPAGLTGGFTQLIRGFQTMLAAQRPHALIINACGRPRFWILPWLARQAGVPAVWVHQMVDAGDHRRLPPRRFRGRMEGLQLWRVPQTVRHRLAAAAATAVIVLNAVDRERITRWQGVPREKIRVIPHGVDGTRFRFDPAGRQRLRNEWADARSTDRSPLIVGTAGRLSAEKGVDLLIEAVAVLRDRRVPAVAVIAGRGAEKGRLQKLAADLGVGEAVKFIDFVEDMPAFYSALDVFVLCSRTESFGLALAEAMACARAVVGTPTAGASRQIRPRHNGWLLNGFSPAELAEAIAALAANEQQRRRMGEQGRESVVRQFSIDLNLERTLRAMRGGGRRGRLYWPGMNERPYVSMAAEDA